MPLRLFQCPTCKLPPQEKYFTAERTPRCSSCEGHMQVVPRSNEGSGHTTHVRVK